MAKKAVTCTTLIFDNNGFIQFFCAEMFKVHRKPGLVYDTLNRFIFCIPRIMRHRKEMLTNGNIKDLQFTLVARTLAIPKAITSRSP